MRNVLIACAALALGSAATASAIAGEVTTQQGQIQTFDVSQSTRGVGTTARLQMTLRQANGSVAAAWDRLELYFPRGMNINTRRFPKCEVSKLQARGHRACPRRSRVGSGSMTADARPALSTVGAKVTAYNGKSKIRRDNEMLLLWVEPTASSPLVIDLDINRRPTGPFGGVFSWSFCCLLFQPSPVAPVTSADIRIGATLRKARNRGARRTARKISYLTIPKRCPDAGFRWQWFNQYFNGELLTIDDAVPCRR